MIGQLFSPVAKVHDIMVFDLSFNQSCPDLLKTKSLDHQHYSDKKRTPTVENPLNLVVTTSDMRDKTW